MKYDLCRKCFDLPSRWFTFTVTWLLMFICGLSAGGNTTQAQTRAYVANNCSNTVTVIDTATNSVIATIPVGINPEGVAITPDGTRAYVANITSQTVSVIDTATNTVIATIPVSSTFPFAVAITPDSARAYVTHLFGSTVSVIDTATNTVIATVPAGGDCPAGIAITPAPRVPRSKEECKNGGYRTFGPPAGPFRNQGQCVNYVETHAHH